MNLSLGRLAGHILDGPKGPAGTVKPGIVRLAQASGAVIVPFTVEADRAWYFNSWDRFMLPKPFSRVKLQFGDMIAPLPRLASRRSFDDQRRHLETMMSPALVSPRNKGRSR